MPQGHVTTARGDILDMDALKNAANMPIVKAKQTKTEVPKRVYDRKPVNLRGFQPGQGAHVPALEAGVVQHIEPDEQPMVISTTASGIVETLADVTGVKVKPTKEALDRAKARAAADGMVPPEDVAVAALGDILGDLEKANPNAQTAADEADTPVRSRSRKT
jgi:hypothetical protein